MKRYTDFIQYQRSLFIPESTKLKRFQSVISDHPSDVLKKSDIDAQAMALSPLAFLHTSNSSLAKRMAIRQQHYPKLSNSYETILDE